MRSSLNRLGLGLVVVAAGGAGCADQVETPCTADMRLGLGIVVMNDRTGAHLCEATVVARSGAHAEALLRTSDARVSGCLYVGAMERPGTYSIQAEAAGFSPSTAGNVTVPISRDSCHVEQVIRTIRLVPTGND